MTPISRNRTPDQNSIDILISWANNLLAVRSIKIVNLLDFSDGYLFIQLIERSFSIAIPFIHYFRSPKDESEKIKNLTVVKTFLTQRCRMNVVFDIPLALKSDSGTIVSILLYILMAKCVYSIKSSVDSPNTYIDFLVLKKKIFNWCEIACFKVTRTMVNINDSNV